MYLENSCGLYNGSLGTCIIRNGITFFKNKEREVQLVKIRRDKIRLGNNGEEIVESFIIQYPIKLAYAITIHKSQGKTFEKVVIDMGQGAFEHGQTYVALSRCKTLKGIVLKQPLRARDIIVDDKIVTYFLNKR